MRRLCVCGGVKNNYNVRVAACGKHMLFGQERVLTPQCQSTDAVEPARRSSRLATYTQTEKMLLG